MVVCPQQSCYCAGGMGVRTCGQEGRVLAQSMYARGCVPEVDVVAESVGCCAAEVVMWLCGRGGRVVVCLELLCGEEGVQVCGRSGFVDVGWGWTCDCGRSGHVLVCSRWVRVWAGEIGVWLCSRHG